MSCQTLISTQPPPECKNVFVEAGLIISQDDSASQPSFTLCAFGTSKCNHLNRIYFDKRRATKTRNEDTAEEPRDMI